MEGSKYYNGMPRQDAITFLMAMASDGISAAVKKDLGDDPLTTLRSGRVVNKHDIAHMTSAAIIGALDAIGATEGELEYAALSITTGLTPWNLHSIIKER